MKKKGAFLAILLAGAMSLGVAGATACKKNDVHTESEHVYSGEWIVSEANKPTASATGRATRSCTANDGGEQSIVLPALTDSGYTITNDTATETSAGTGTYTITIDGEVISFTAATPKKGAAHVHVGSGSWQVEEANKPTGTSTGLATRPCTANDGGVESKALPALSDSRYTVKTTPTSGISQYTISIDGVSISFTAATYVKPVDPSGDPDPDENKKSYSVKFMNGDVEVKSETVESGNKVSAPSITKSGHYLKGWYENAQGTGKAFDFGTAITSAKTLYAIWVAIDERLTYNSINNEGVSFEWGEGDTANAKVEYKISSESSYTRVDSQLIRQISNDTARADIVGLKGGAKYDFKITPSSGNEITLSEVTVNEYDRSGFAHFNYSDGVGAYKDDGTLKDNALVIYVTDENKNTVSLTYGGLTVTGIGNILNSVGQDTGNGTTSNGGTRPNTNGGIIKKLADDNIPLVVRFIGCVSDSGLYRKATFNAASTPEIDGLTIYDSTDHGGSVGDNGHMARIKSGKDITLEGIGEDAVIDGWGFHFMAESSSGNLGKSFEVRNLTFINTPEDAIGMEGVQASKNASSDLTASVERCWIHNNEFYGPSISNPAESDKAEGDGSCDFKRGQYFTCSYNYFEGCHKTNLVGSADYSLQYNLTYHHNYWKLCKARGPLARRANIHMYNNVFEGQTDYAMNTRADAYIFSEYNLFYMCKSPQAVEGGAIKSYNDSFSSYLINKGSMGTVVSSKSQIVNNNCKFAARNIDYSRFDTNSAQSYIPDGNYILQTNVTEARKAIAALAGVNKRYAKSVGDITLSDLSFVPGGVTPQKITEYPSTVTPGKISKTVYAFNLDHSATVSISYASDGLTNTGVLLNEAGECLLTASGSVNLNPGTYIIQPTNFQPGDSKTLSSGTFKEMTINSISFEKYESEEFNAKLIADYDTKAGLINIDSIGYDNASYQLIQNAKNAYNVLPAELKERVTVPYATVTAALNKYIDSGKAEVERLINEIGTVNENSGSKISKARLTYQELVKLAPDVTVSNYNTLVQAEAAYEQFEVAGISNAIAALADPSTATTEEAIRALLDEYNAVKDMYYDLDEDKRPQVTNTQKVTNGIAALEEALKPFEVKELIATLPESTAADYISKAGELKAAYEALTAAQKEMITADEKAIYDAAVAAYNDYVSKAVTISFTPGRDDNYLNRTDFIEATSYAKKDKTNTYNGVQYTQVAYLDSSAKLTIKAQSAERKLIIHFMTGGGTVDINGHIYDVSANPDLVINLDAGTAYTIKKNTTSNNFIYLMEIVPA